MKNRILSIFAAIAVTLSLSACQNSNTEQTVPLSESATTIVEEAVEMKIIEPPEDGWTVEKLAKCICVSEQRFSYPCSISNLNQVYYGKEIKTNADNTISAVLQYNETIVATVILENCQKYSDINSQTCISSFCSSTVLDIDSNADSKLLSVNGVSTYMDKEKVISYLGIPDINNDTYYTYIDKKTDKEILTISFDNELVVGIFVYL